MREILLSNKKLVSVEVWCYLIVSAITYYVFQRPVWIIALKEAETLNSFQSHLLFVMTNNFVNAIVLVLGAIAAFGGIFMGLLQFPRIRYWFFYKVCKYEE